MQLCCVRTEQVQEVHAERTKNRLPLLHDIVALLRRWPTKWYKSETLFP